MHRIHQGFTVVAAIKNGKSDELKKMLKSLNKTEKTDLINFDGSGTTLFVSGLILPQQDYHTRSNVEKLPESFVFATSFSGPLSDHIDDLIATSKKGLCEIFKHCKNFPEDEIDDRTLASYLKSHKYPSAFSSRFSCITKSDVRREKELRKEIEDYLDKAQHLNAFNSLSALQIRSLIQRHIKVCGNRYQWAAKPDKKSWIELLMAKRLQLMIVVLLSAFLFGLFYNAALRSKMLIGALIIFIVLFSAIAIAVLVAYYISRTTNVTATRPGDDIIRKIAASQLRPVLNEMTAAAPLKKGRLRRHFYTTVLWILKRVSHMNVPTVSTIRWLVVDDKKRLLFLSNYSNTTDFYVRDFLNGSRTPKGINFMFTNGMGFPDAKLLFKKGISSDPEGYMHSIHSGQHITHFWYAHDASLTVDAINKNRKIRNGLFKRMDEEGAKQWLKLL